MKHRLLAGCMIVLAIFAALPSVLFCLAERDILETEAYFDQAESLSGLVDVPYRGEIFYYAQNDGLWREMVYETRESKKSRPFGDGGCAPSAVGMAIANMVAEEELDKVSQYAKNPYSICSCSVNRYKCRHDHARYLVTSVRDFERFLPLIFADFAAGNNTLGVISRSEDKGTSTGFVHHLASVYGLSVSTTTDYRLAVEAVKNGQSVVAHSRAGSVFTNTGHYIFLAAADDERMYVLDPLCREEYTAKNSKKLTVMQPGLVTFKHEDVSIAGFGGFIIFSDVVSDGNDAPMEEWSESTVPEETAEEVSSEVLPSERENTETEQ